MDFLSSLYSNENFGIILFAVISILVLAFLLILFFGKKDQKDRKLAETKKIELENQEQEQASVAFQETEPAKPIEIPVEPIAETMVRTPNLVLNEDLITEANQEEIPNPVELINQVPKPLEEPVMPNKEFDFDALAASISKELESIGKPEPEAPIEEPKQEETKIPTFDSLVELTSKALNPEEKEEPAKNASEMPSALEVKEKKEEVMDKPKMPRPTQFSSVFVTKKKETIPEIKEDIKEEPEIPETKVEPIIPEPVPVKPTFELPKTIDLPKLNNDPVPNPEPVIKNNTSNIIFPSLENDIPAYPKNDENRM